MNKIYIFFGLFLLVSCAPNEVPFENLVQRQGVTYEINSQTPFTGITLHYYDSGQYMGSESFKDGEREGLWDIYHRNGQLSERGNLKDGVSNGLKESYSKEGELYSKTCYKNGDKIDMFYCEK